MLQLEIKGKEFWDEKNQEFIQVKSKSLQLEHSLVSLSKWESKWKKPFLSKNKNDIKTREETLDYIRCMTITQNVDPNIYNCLSEENIRAIIEYIDDPMSATTVPQSSNKGSKEILTSELLYYYMFSCGISLECQKWHLNRLIKLIEVFGFKNNPKKNKKSKADVLSQYRKLNEERRNSLHTAG